MSYRSIQSVSTLQEFHYQPSHKLFGQRLSAGFSLGKMNDRMLEPKEAVNKIFWRKEGKG